MAIFGLVDFCSMNHLTPRDSAESTGLTGRIRLFTHIVSPPVIYAVLGFVVAWSQVPFLEGLFWGIVHGLLVSLAPILYVVWLLKHERIGDINMTKEERRGPYFVAVLCASLASAIIYYGGGPEYLFHLSLLNILALGAMAAINWVWQISNHSTAIVSAMWVLGVVFDRRIAMAMLPLVVVVCFARLYLRRHTPSQVLAGLALGSFSVLALFLTGCFGG